MRLLPEHCFSPTLCWLGVCFVISAQCWHVCVLLLPSFVSLLSSCKEKEWKGVQSCDINDFLNYCESILTRHKMHLLCVTYEVIGSIPGQLQIFLSLCSLHIVVLHHTKSYYGRVMYFLKICNRILLYGPIEVAIMLIPPQNVFFRHVGITDIRKFKSILLGYSPVA